jgi:hypothetical protein
MQIPSSMQYVTPCWEHLPQEILVRIFLITDPDFKGIDSTITIEKDPCMLLCQKVFGSLNIDSSDNSTETKN